MRAISFPVLSIMLAGAAMAQTPGDGLVDRVFHFANVKAPAGRQEIMIAMRSIAEIQRIASVGPMDALALRGTAAQIGLAEWIFGEVDMPANAQPAPSVREYRLPDDRSPVVRVYFLAHAVQPRAMQEVINSIRSIAEVQRLVAFTAQAAILTRGTLDQAELTDWLVQQMDRPAGAPADKKPLEYRFPAERDSGAVRAYHLTYAATPMAGQELINAIRSITEIQRAMLYNPTATMTVRGTPAQAALADWLVQELDRPAEAQPAASSHEYAGPVDGGAVVRVVRLAHTRSPGALQQLVGLVRMTAEMQRVVAYPGTWALVLRGTPVQLATAERLIQESDSAPL